MGGRYTARDMWGERRKHRRSEERSGASGWDDDELFLSGSFSLFVFLSICHSVSFGSTEELRVDELPVDRLRGSERSFYT
jgi:hypothetical protein